MSNDTDRPIRHPRWCTERAVCAEYDTHTSKKYAINPEGDEPARLTVWMEQLVNYGTSPIIVVEAVTDGKETPYVLPISQSRVLAFTLRRLLDAAKSTGR